MKGGGAHQTFPRPKQGCISPFCFGKSLQDGKVARLASDEEGTYGKAYLKYSDAVSFSSDNYLYHLHVGRFLLLQEKHDEAVKRLQIAVGLKPVNIESRCVLANTVSGMRSMGSVCGAWKT